MVLKPIIEKALNKQIVEELYSSYLYLAMSAYFEDMNLPGFAAWMKSQWQEEIVHALKMFNYIVERGGRAELGAIKQPQKSWKSALDVYEAAYKHEQYITKCIHDLIDLANKQKDHATISFLQWYVDEQVEEESTADDMVQKIKMVKDMPGGIYIIDKEAGTRPLISPRIAGILTPGAAGPAQ